MGGEQATDANIVEPSGPVAGDAGGVERTRIPATVTPAVAAFDVHLPMLRRYLRTLGARSDRVDDLVQETLVVALQKQIEDRGPWATAGGLSAPMWDTLARMPRLRHLTFRGGRDEASFLEKVVRLEQLEHLQWFGAALPAAEPLRRLRALPGLRRVVIVSDGGGQHQAEVEALQQALGPGVHLLVS